MIFNYRDPLGNIIRTHNCEELHQLATSLTGLQLLPIPPRQVCRFPAQPIAFQRSQVRTRWATRGTPATPIWFPTEDWRWATSGGRSREGWGHSSETHRQVC